jgi:hypothetical protein
MRYSGRTTPETPHQRLTTAPRGATSDYGPALAGITLAYVAALSTIVDQIHALTE